MEGGSSPFRRKLSGESVQGLGDVCRVASTEVYSPALFNERALKLGLGTGVPADMVTGWNLETKSRRDKCSSLLRSAKPKVSTASPPCPSFLVLPISTMGAQVHWMETEERESSQHDHISHCLHGKNKAFESSLLSQAFSNDPCVAGICCLAGLCS